MSTTLKRPLTLFNILLAYFYVMAFATGYLICRQNNLLFSNLYEQNNFLKITSLLFVYLLQFLPLYLYFRPTLSWLGLIGNGKTILLNLAAAVLLFLGFFFTAIPWSKIGGLGFWNTYDSSVICYFFVVGFCEQVIWCGFFQHALEEKLGTGLGILICSVLFACSHIPQRMIVGGMAFSDTMRNVLSLIPFGFILGSISKKNDTLYGGILIHWVADWI